MNKLVLVLMFIVCGGVSFALDSPSAASVWKRLNPSLIQDTKLFESADHLESSLHKAIPEIWSLPAEEQATLFVLLYLTDRYIDLSASVSESMDKAFGGSPKREDVKAMLLGLSFDYMHGRFRFSEEDFKIFVQYCNAIFTKR